MKKKKLKKQMVLIILMGILFVSSILPFKQARAKESNYNRFNVMIVLDASSSMDYTDPSHLRYKAIGQFVNLLAKKGNMLGGLVFSDQIAGQQAPIAADSQESKDQVLQMLKDATTTLENTETPDGLRYTNIGGALNEAVSMLKESGNPDLPSVILLLSDGNTEMPTEEELDTSLELKAEAIQEAREQGIEIYNVCLNANGRADIAETEQISNATGGVAKEVSTPEDLQEVFNAFYDLIYGTATIPIVEGEFPDSGKLETTFDVPGLGVEEVNIVIYGVIDNLSLKKPDGTSANSSVQSYDTFTMVKMTDVVPGRWTLITEGTPGNSIKINMVYNTNLEIEVNTASEKINAGEEWYVEASLKTGDQYASSIDQYEGYEADLQIYDVYGELLYTVPMELFEDSHSFVGKYVLEEGSYFYGIHVKGDYIEKTTEQYGPLTVIVSTEEETVPENQPPVPVKDRVEKSVYIWPIKGGHFTLDLKTLATDEEDNELRYTIVSSSFLANEDYTVDEEMILTQEQFSLKKGSYTVKATDSGGLSCEIEVVVKTHNVGIMTLIGLLIVILVVIVILGIRLYIALIVPFLGKVYVTQETDGRRMETIQIEKPRGRIRLHIFGLQPSGLNYKKCYFQATGKDYITLITNKPVYYAGNPASKIMVMSSISSETTVCLDQEGRNRLYIRFESILKK